MINVPDLHSYRWIVCNSSSGKDSQTALRRVVGECRKQGVSLDRVVVSHQCLGKAEWPGTLELVQQHAAHYGLRLEVSGYKNAAGESPTLLDYVRRRGKWPDSTNRWCTSEFKRGPGLRVITKLCREAQGDVLNVFGFRAEESTARAKKQASAPNKRASRKSRRVDDWLPIHDWTLDAVWADIRESGVPWHYAYDLGMSRLSCILCIFAPRAALIIAGRANPETLDEYVEVEEETGHTFQNGRSLKEIKQAIADGEQPKDVGSGAWNM